jgi:hypothetical protein
MLFHAPHCGQRPISRALTRPHCWQIYWVRIFVKDQPVKYDVEATFAGNRI